MVSSIDPLALSRDGIEAAARRLAPHVIKTPVVEVEGAAFGLPGATLVFKLELLQVTNAFKFRGAVNHMLAMAEAGEHGGVVTVSSGNHGISLAEAGRRFGVRVVVMMGPKANPWRRERIQALGAEVRIIEDLNLAFEVAEHLAVEDRLRFVHPYDGVQTLEGTASLGLEFGRQAGRLDAVVLPIGGGGLAAGMGFGMRALQPDLTVFGVEPTGAPTMSGARAAGAPVALTHIETVADSLGAPKAAPLSFALCQEHIAEVLLLDDAETEAAMREIYSVLRQAIEPSAAIGAAAVLGPLRERLAGQRIGLILCGANQEPTRQFSMLTGRNLIPA